MAQVETLMIVYQVAPQCLCSDSSGCVPLSRSGGLTCPHKLVSTSRRPVLSRQYLGMECCGTGSAPGTVAQDQLRKQKETGRARYDL